MQPKRIQWFQWLIKKILTSWFYWILSGWLFVERLYIKTINRSKRACRRNGRGREKLLRATGWPKSDLGVWRLTSWIIRVFFERTERTKEHARPASFVNDFNDLHGRHWTRRFPSLSSVLSPARPQPQKTQGSEFFQWNQRLRCWSYSSSVKPKTPPNLQNGIPKPLWPLQAYSRL